MTQPNPTRDAALLAMAKWVSTIADNIRNPISGIGAALNILEQELTIQKTAASTTSPLIDDALLRIRGRLTSLGEYVSELIDFAKPAVIYLESVQLAPLFQRLKLSANTALPTVHIEIAVDPDAGTIDADNERLRVMLKGLLRNATEAALNSPTKKAPKVIISAVRDTQAGNTGVRLEIADNGPGFSELAESQAFEPFFSTKEAGTGLGLATASKVAIAHGGLIKISRSTKLGGALVSLFLPDRESNLKSNELRLAIG